MKHNCNLKDIGINRLLLFLLLYLSGSLILIYAQCPNFTELNGSNVTCQYGDTHNPMQFTGIVLGRHTVITQQGSDPNTGHQLPFLPPGENAVVKLGNEQVGAQAEAITYRFTVDTNKAILLLKFAVVFEDPEHPSSDQPRFVVRVLNDAGQLVDECAEYDVTAAGDIPGFQNYISGWHNIRWRPWTNVGIDLSNYIGQTVRVQFVTYDCSRFGHFGYAYFTASCINNQLALNGCNGDQMTLIAPSDFASYSWNNGSTDISATYTINGTSTANCLITSVTGCHFMLSGTITTETNIPSSNIIIYDTICEGDIYCQNFFSLPIQNDLGTHVFRNTFFISDVCSGGDVTSTLFLTILPHYNHIYETACQGMDYNSNGFHYTNLQIGSFTDTLITSQNAGCDLITILHLTVNHSFMLNNSIIGETSVCSNEVFSYTLPNIEGLSFIYWVVPDGVIILTGQETSEVNLYFTNEAPNPAELSLLGANGCGSGSIPLYVTHFPTYHVFIQDSICTGNDYHQNGFDIARQDSTGWFTFTNHYATIQGCDSVYILQLLVSNTPSLTTLAQPNEICLGQSAIVHALGENAGLIQGGHNNTIAIGDILCTDNTIVKPSAWPVEGKTAMGIVFYVDNTDEHGWAVHLQDQGTSVPWTPDGLETDISTLTNYINSRDAIMDLDGYLNTANIQNAGNASIYPAAYAVDFANGWYLPAIGQLRILIAEINTINVSLQIVGGTQFPVNTGWDYWSSTEASFNMAYLSASHGTIHNWIKGIGYRVRSIRSF